MEHEVTMMPIVISVLGTVPKKLGKETDRIGNQ